MKTCHYGHYVDSDTPITGVISNNDISQFLSDEMYNMIDLTYEEFADEVNGDENYTEDEKEEILSNYESDGDTYLIGGWKQDENGLYEPDQSSEYSAIIRYDVTQVVWSQHTTHAPLCSPCYPGQADVNPDYDGEYLAYTLPHEAFQKY